MTDPAQHSRTPKPWRCWLRYSLASLFVVVSGTCVVLAAWVVPAERQKRAVAAIEAAGGDVWYDDEGTGSRKQGWVAGLIGVDYVASPEAAWLASGTTDAELACASQLKSIKLLSLHDFDLTESRLSLFSGHTELRSLYLHKTDVNPKSLANFARSRHLEKLWLNRTNVGDEGLSHLRQVTILRRVALTGDRITDRGMGYLAELSLLELLHIEGSPVTDSGLMKLQSCKRLKLLKLFGTNVTTDGAARFREMLPDCKVVGP